MYDIHLSMGKIATLPISCMSRLCTGLPQWISSRTILDFYNSAARAVRALAYCGTWAEIWLKASHLLVRVQMTSALGKYLLYKLQGQHNLQVHEVKVSSNRTYIASRIPY